MLPYWKWRHSVKVLLNVVLPETHTSARNEASTYLQWSSVIKTTLVTDNSESVFKVISNYIKIGCLGSTLGQVLIANWSFHQTVLIANWSFHQAVLTAYWYFHQAVLIANWSFHQAVLIANRSFHQVVLIADFILNDHLFGSLHQHRVVFSIKEDPNTNYNINRDTCIVLISGGV